MQILVVEDDTRLAQALSHILEESGYHVDTVDNGQAGYEYGRSEVYDAIILDVMLPGLNGYQVATALRRDGISTPLLMLTAKSTVQDKVVGLDSGADAYMTKPFSPAELMANLRAITRRRGEVMFETLTAGDLSLNLKSSDLACADNTIHLTYKEFLLTKILMEASPHVVAKDVLISKVWGVESSADDNNVEAYISFIRKKLKFLKSETKLETLRKVGYRLRMEETEKAEDADPQGLRGPNLAKLGTNPSDSEPERASTSAAESAGSARFGTATGDEADDA